MIIRILTLIFLLCWPASYSMAQTQNKIMTIDLENNKINITTGFNGAHLTLFGVKKQPGDLAIVIQGPARQMVVRRKDQIMGVWVNHDSLGFRNVPAYYDLALSKAERKIAPAALMQSYGIGLDALNFDPVANRSDPENIERFKEALVRNKQRQGHFPLEPKNIIFLNDDFFRADFYVPSNVPTGDYSIKTYLFQQGKLREINEKKLRVAQVGFSAKLYKFAHLQGLAYGLVAVLMGLLAGAGGWLFLRQE
ncbi:MAG: transmembrane family protein [Alphaproteobacteria bacterium CG_4_9_14_3_um_filter_47_13]|nr:MAG: transmembrane family protein [Alphaproteobacteria bacterium CG_4_9_14_3_um_filter_47_13]